MRTPWNKGKKLSAKHIENIKESLKGRTPWNKGKVGLMPVPWNKGKAWDEATKEKIGASRKGITPWNLGKPWSEEMKAKFSESAKKRYADKNNSGDSASRKA